MTANTTPPAWDDDRFVAADFETSGAFPEYALQPWRIPQGRAWATSLVWVRKTPDGFDVQGGVRPTVDDMRRCLADAAAANRAIVGWNLVFDIAVFLAHGLEREVFACKWLDGMLLWRHADIEPEYELERHKKRSYGLKTAVAEFLPKHAGYEEGVDFHATDAASLERLHQYNIRDNIFALRITKHLYNFLLRDDPQRLRAALIEAKSLPLVAQANLTGMLIDRIAVRELSQTLTDASEKALDALSGFGVSEDVVRSPTKLAALLFDQWGLPVLKENTGKKTGKVSRATDKEVLHELAFLDGRAKTVREYREALNNRTKFAEAPLQASQYNGDGRAHPEAHIFGTYSGRLTYSSNQTVKKDRGDGRVTIHKFQTGFALHQEKRAAEFRRIVIAPEGYDLVEFDAAGQEFRWMAIASGDETMLALCAPGEDAHAYMGARIFAADYQTLRKQVAEKVPEAEAARQMGKVANLCVAAGTKILTDRGFCNIENVTRADRVWDGVAFVEHDGVVCSGYRRVISHDGVTATPEHRVLVDGGGWITIAEAARWRWRICSAWGETWPCKARSIIKIASGLLRRAMRSGLPREIFSPNHQQRNPPEQAWVYDIVNCGPRHRFAANGRIVHNSLQYRTSPKKLRVVARVQYNLPMPLQDAQFIWRTYQQTYIKVPRYWATQIALTRQRQYVETFAGRRVQVVGNWDGPLSWSMGSTAINYRIQGTGADQKYLALAVLRPYLQKIGAKFAWDLHDGIYFWVPKQHTQRFVVEGQKILNNLPYQQAWGFTPPIPMPWDCKVGPTWGDLKAVK